MKLADLGGQARGCVRRRSPRSRATGLKTTWTNVCLRVCSSDRSSDSNAVPMVVSLTASSTGTALNSKGLDKLQWAQVWSRTCYTHV